MTCPACLTRHPSFKVHLAVHLKIESCDRHDADGRNPAPVDRYLVHAYSFCRVYTYEVVQDLGHQH